MQDLFDSEVEILEPMEFWKDFFEHKFSSEIRRFVRRYPTDKSLIIPVPLVVEFGKNGIKYADLLIKEPDESLREIYAAIQHYKLIKKNGEVLPVKIRFSNLERKTTVRDLRGPVHVGTFVSVEGSIRRTSSRKERLVEGVFRCTSGHRTVKKQPYSMKEVPSECSMDGCRKKSIELVESASVFIDSQKALLQEYYELVNPGSQPESIEIELTADLIDSLYAGNRVVINGILRRFQTASSKTSTTYKNYIEVNSIEITEKDYSEIVISEEDELTIRTLAADPNIFARLSSSIVPEVYGLEDVKEACMYSFFGGLITETSNGVNTRGSIHILLIGEPGIAKTDFMRKVMVFSPRSVYTSGKGSSGVGLVASLTKDEFNDGSHTLEAGAMALADKGVCIIDEINQIDTKDLSLLYEALESQQATIHKSNIHTTIPTRCGVIAAANPKHGWIDDFIPLKDQIELPGPFLQRFDLIYILKDEVNLEKDERIIRHIIANRSGSGHEKFKPDVEPELFRKYVALAKQQPIKWSKPAEDEVVKYYLKIRGTRDKSGTKPVPITPRQGNSIARIAEASARIRFSSKVELEDIHRARTVLDACLRKIAYDPETGMFDSGPMTAGTTKKQGNLIDDIFRVIKEISDPQTGWAKEILVIEGLRGKYDHVEIEKRIESLYQDKSGKLIRPRDGYLKVVG
jgi:replicative DNA helicase Mcm